MGTPHEGPGRDVPCASCGAPLAPDATTCAVCGRPVVTSPAAEPAAPVVTAAMAAPATAVDAAPPAPSPVAAGEGQRVCAWCGEENPADATQCFKCGAAFPRPEQDALLNRVSEERMRLALDEIELHERLRTPWWKKLFGGGGKGGKGGKGGATT